MHVPILLVTHKNVSAELKALILEPLTFGIFSKAIAVECINFVKSKTIYPYPVVKFKSVKF
jgi:hypothetical protein